MKKVFVMLMLLLVGLTAFSGCSTSTNVQVDSSFEEDNGNIEGNVNVEVENSANNNIPQPPALPED